MSRPEGYARIDNQQTRSPSDVVFKTLIIAASTGIAAGHLTTLRRISRKDNADAIISVLGFFLVPTLPLASLFVNFWKSLRFIRRNQGQRWGMTFFLSATLGIRATVSGTDEDADESVGLLHVQHDHLVRRRKRYDSRWLGRLTVQLLFGCQTAMTTVLAIRRFQRVSEYGETAFASWDYYGGMLALGGLGTCITSITATVLNTSWQVDSVTKEEARTVLTTRGRVVRAIFDVGFGPGKDVEIWAELQTARVLFFLISIPISWHWIGSTLWSRMYLPAGYIVLPIDINQELSQRPNTDYATTKLYLLALSIAISGVLVIPLGIVFTSLTGRLCQCSNPSLSEGARNIACTVFRIFLNLYSFIVVVFVIHGFIQEKGRLKTSRDEGLWLEIMWVDPWTEKLCEF